MMQEEGLHDDLTTLRNCAAQQISANQIARLFARWQHRCACELDAAIGHNYYSRCGLPFYLHVHVQLLSLVDLVILCTRRPSCGSPKALFSRPVRRYVRAYYSACPCRSSITLRLACRQQHKQRNVFSIY